VQPPCRSHEGWPEFQGRRWSSSSFPRLSPGRWISRARTGGSDASVVFKSCACDWSLGQDFISARAPSFSAILDLFCFDFYFFVWLLVGLGLLAQSCYTHPHLLLCLNNLHPPLNLILSDFQLICKSTYLAYLLI
jgi:hypothetical protein